MTLLTFFVHARGSLHELETQTLIAKSLGYVAESEGTKLEELLAETGRMLNGLISSMRGKTPGPARFRLADEDCHQPLAVRKLRRFGEAQVVLRQGLI